MQKLHFILLIFILTACDQSSGPGKQILVTEGRSQKIVDAYWLYLPKAYEQKRKWPMIMYLQGGEASASPNPNTVRDAGPFYYITQPKSVLPDSFVIVNPHMRTGSRADRQWYKNAAELAQIVDEVVANHNVDPDRVYLAGLSRGGIGTWGTAKRFPEKFAAIIPVAGALTCKSRCEEIKNMPMWIMHNTGDPVIEYDYAESTVIHFESEFGKTFVQRSDVNIPTSKIEHPNIFSSIDSNDHGVTEAFSTAVVYDWLLDKRKD
ncbi:MAG: PHB depolymerase family esterase [Cytophagales bacterium]|nr:PHB depolymerase family esterase [Cytophagales bacterium]